MKQLYIIGGPNGAGKTTASYTILPEILQCSEFVNADEIARGLSPFNPEGMAIEAGRLMLQRIQDLLEEGKSFAIETTMATRSYAKLIERAQGQGYQVTIFYFWLNSPVLAQNRVAERVLRGGHNIPANVILRRYQLGRTNFFNIFLPLADKWILVDNSNPQAEIVAQGGRDSEQQIYDFLKWKEVNHGNNECGTDEE